MSDVIANAWKKHGYPTELKMVAVTDIQRSDKAYFGALWAAKRPTPDASQVSGKDNLAKLKLEREAASEGVTVRPGDPEWDTIMGDQAGNPLIRASADHPDVFNYRKIDSFTMVRDGGDVGSIYTVFHLADGRPSGS